MKRRRPKPRKIEPMAAIAADWEIRELMRILAHALVSRGRNVYAWEVVGGGIVKILFNDRRSVTPGGWEDLRPKPRTRRTRSKR